MRRSHLAATQLIVLSIIAAAFQHTRPPKLGQPTPCLHPYLLSDNNDIRQLVVCTDAASLSTAQLLKITNHPCVDYDKIEQISKKEEGFVHSASSLTLDRNCVLSIGEIPGHLRLVLGLTLDLNRASAAELQALPQIGPRRAQRIVRYRQQRGLFRSPAELEGVHGIGPMTIARLRGLISVQQNAGPK